MLASSYISALDIFSTFMKTGDIKAYRLSKSVYTWEMVIFEVCPPKTQTKPAAAQQACVRCARLDDSYAKCRCCLVEADVVPPTGEHKAPLDA